MIHSKVKKLKLEKDLVHLVLAEEADASGEKRELKS